MIWGLLPASMWPGLSDDSLTAPVHATESVVSVLGRSRGICSCLFLLLSGGQAGCGKCHSLARPLKQAFYKAWVCECALSKRSKGKDRWISLKPLRKHRMTLWSVRLHFAVSSSYVSSRCTTYYSERHTITLALGA